MIFLLKTHWKRALIFCLTSLFCLKKKKVCGCSLRDPSSVFYLIRTSVFNRNHLRSLCSLADETQATQSHFILILVDRGTFWAAASSLSSLFKELRNELEDFGPVLVLSWPWAQVKGKWSLDLATDAGVNLKVHQGDMLGPGVLSADVKFAQLVGLRRGRGGKGVRARAGSHNLWEFRGQHQTT